MTSSPPDQMGMAKENKFSRYFVFGLLFLWALVSLAALLGMYKLWWERERQSYSGKSIAEQRQQVMRVAGLPERSVEIYQQIDRTWPGNIGYTTQGDHNTLSYLKYLLIPRIPSGSSNYRLDDSGVFAPSEREQSSTSLTPTQSGGGDGRGKPLALLGAVAVFAGLALGARTLLAFARLSFPEAFGLGLFLCMLLLLGSRLVFPTISPGCQFLTILGAGGWLRYWTCRLRREGGSEPPRGLRDHLRVMCFSWAGARRVFLLTIILGNILWALAMAVIVVPDDWDAWAIWAAKAKVLALGAGPLADVSYFGHADYPLLWPAVWAYSGWWGGGWEELWSRGWGSVFLTLAVWELAVIVQRMTGDNRYGLLSAALFVSVPMVPLIASWSYAEAPFWLLVLCASGCLSLYDNDNEKSALAPAALLAVAAMYTKNEGVLLAGALAIWLLVSPGPGKMRGLAIFFATVALCYLPWIIWTRVIMEFGSHATAGFHLDVSTLTRAWGRAPAMFEAIFSMWGDIKQWNIVLWLALLFLMPSVFVRKSRRWILLALVLAGGYLLIILFHEAEIYWQVGTSWNRLTVHFLPFLVIAMVGLWHENMKKYSQ